MLPSAGYFKGFNCPFYDSGLCERPYCHFRHVKNDSLILQNDEFESGAILQKLVSAAVQKVLEQTEKSAAASYSQPLVSECISDTPQVIAPAPVQSTSKAKYNPTPISELKKIIDEADEQSKREEEAAQLRRKHIPVPYTPRKPPSLPINRPADIDESGAELFTYLPPPTKYTPGCGEISAPDPYLPEGTKIFPDPYLQGNKDEHEHAPIQTQLSDKPNYVPSDKKSARKKRLEYNPTKVTHNHGSSAVKYQPTPKSLVPVFSSDEEEPEIKKTKISNDLGNFDDLGPEFDMLDEILEEENGDEKSVSKINSDQMLQSKNESQPIENHKDSKKNKKSSSDHKEQRPISNVKKKHKTNETSSHGSKEKNNESKSNRDRSKEKTKDKHDKKEDRSTSKDKSEKHVKKSNHSSNKDKTEKHDNKDNRRSSKDKSEKNYNKNDHSSSKDKSEKHDKKDDHISSRDKSEKIKQKDSNKKDSNNSHSSDSSSKNSKSNTKNHEKHSSSSNQSKPSSSKDSSQHKHTSKHKSKHREDKKKSKEKHEKDAKRARSNSTHSLNDFDDTELADDELVISSESDEESRAIECKRIFEEYIPMAKPTTVPTVENVANHSETVEYVPGKIRISRTSDKNIKVQPRPAIKPDFKLNAAQTMNDRLAKVREYHIKKTDNHHTSDTNNATIFASQSESVKNTPSSYTNNSSSKIRIAHVPYASTLVNAKKLYTPTQALKKDVPSTSTTIVQTVKKGEQRTAHIPNEKFIDRPGVLEPLASKIPANIRSIYLNMMIDECLKIYILPADAYARAQHEELTTSKKCSKVQIYKNSAVLAVTRLRKELQECDGIKKSGSECSALQNIPRTGSNQTNNASSWSIESKNRGDKFSSKDFKGAQFYKNISKWILTEEQLLENGFPMAHPSREKGRAIISGEKRQKQKPPKGNIRTCCRCNQDYTVDKRGFPAVKQECIYHPNRKYRYRGEAKYQCCGQDGMSDGCCAAPCHVWEYVDYDNLKGFVTTLPSATEMSDYGVYALDCEMCYTTHGLDLTRITVIDSSCKVVYETLIKPLHPIIDYNTRYSGITEEQMADVKTTLLEVQASLLTMFNSKTILIGHSLESDFKALKLIHGTVIDTSVMFPHKMGPPFKRALRNLSSEYLKKIIQNSVEGHDSAEDATVCMELVIYKLKEDLKTS